MWNSVSFLSGVAWWSLVATAIFGGLAVATGLVGGIAATRASDLKGREDAKEIEGAKASAAKANADAAEANARADEARLKIVQLQDAMAWRELSPNQHQALVEALHGRPLEIWNSFVGDDPEAVRYRDQIEGALLEAGVNTHFFSGWKQAAGVSILGGDCADGELLSAALHAAGITHQIKPPHGNLGVAYPALVIGTKPERL